MARRGLNAHTSQTSESPGVLPPLQEFFIPIQGLVRLLEAQELPIVDHPAFQHLGHIYQLGQTYLVYRGATHTRFEHSLGTRAVAEMMIQALHRNLGRRNRNVTAIRENWRLGKELSRTERRFVRLGALLHDIGHLPAGHTLEDELGRLDSHDRHDRLTRVLDRRDWNSVHQDESLRDVVDRTFAKDAREARLFYVNKGGRLSASQIVEVLISKDRMETKHNDDFRVDVCRDLIGNTICADLLDYLHRDWHHIGKERAFDPRILEYLEIRTKEESGRSDSRLVINVGSGQRVRTDAVTAILDLLESRYQLSEIALFHRTKISAAAMLERAVAELTDLHSRRGEAAFLNKLEKRLLDASDAEMLTVLIQMAAAKKRLGAADKQKAQAVIDLAGALRVRDLHKTIDSRFEYQLPHRAKALQDLYSGPSSVKDRRHRALIGARNRLAAARLIERDFGLPAGSFVMYCPPPSMNSKIAEVQIFIHGEVYRLADFEEGGPDQGITGGHLAAQQRRFRRLWRVHFALRRDVRDTLAESGLLEDLGRAIDRFILGLEPTVGTFDQDVGDLVRKLSRKRGTRLYGRRPLRIQELAVAASQEEVLSYPTGAITLLDRTAERAV